MIKHIFIATIKPGISDAKVEDQDSFNRLLNSEAHQQVTASTGDVFRTDNFVLSQIEF